MSDCCQLLTTLSTSTLLRMIKNTNSPSGRYFGRSRTSRIDQYAKRDRLKPQLSVIQSEARFYFLHPGCKVSEEAPIWGIRFEILPELLTLQTSDCVVAKHVMRYLWTNQARIHRKRNFFVKS